ncbi:MAG: hypothetical protein PHP74_00510 [Candidatus Gracilibacteria bacterium]|nr:hypothetical protein [Candidatus Gracilibacteria bacterium]
MNKKYKIGVVIVAIFIALCLLFFVNKPPTIGMSNIKEIALIDYSSDINFRQTVNDCGPYNVATVVRALKKEKIDSSKFAKEIKWRLPNKYTLPLGLERQLKENGINIEIPQVKRLSDRDKIAFLHEQLSLGNPIVILGGIDHYQHYMTIFGFNSNKDEFYIYDSLQEENPDNLSLTIDENDELPGNKSMSSKDLMDFWRKGGMYGIYKWYAIVASL